jgi:probable F420-dependent oxidoreductase
MNIDTLIIVTEKVGDLAAIAREVERLGYHALWIPEHPIIPVDRKTPFFFMEDGKLPEHYARWADPFVALTVAAAVTTRLKLGTGVCLMPERDPIVTAKVVASLDLFSAGRVILGVGAGWLKEETEVFGGSFGTRWKRLRESVEAMRVLWTQREASYQGEMIRFPAVRSEPKPVQKPYPPVTLGAHGPNALERVARYCDGWMPLLDDPAQLGRDVAKVRDLARRNGRDPDSIQVTPIVDPHEQGLTTDELRAFRNAGANRLILFSQAIGMEQAEGNILERVRRYASVVERARSIP